MGKQMVTVKIYDEETDELLDTFELDTRTMVRLHQWGEEQGIPEEDLFSVIYEKGAEYLDKQIKDVEARVNEFDPLLIDKVRSMMFETLKEMREPDWEYPEGMQILGDAPPEAIAEAIVRMRLHMSEHEN